MRCDELARALSAAIDGEALDARASRHVGSCLRCQAELAQYRKLIRVLRTLRAEGLSPGPSLAVDVLAGLEQGGGRSAVRSLVGGRRPFGVSGLVVAGAAAAGAGAVLARRQRPHRRQLAACEARRGRPCPTGLSLAGRRGQ